MACGLPVVATAVGGNPELVADGRTGLLVGLGDDEALTAALLRLARERAFAKDCGRAGRERVLAEFSIDAMALAFQALHRTLMAKARRDR
jgi:glycosyltransferase involved in cell wall biosynthesis